MRDCTVTDRMAVQIMENYEHIQQDLWRMVGEPVNLNDKKMLQDYKYAYKKFIIHAIQYMLEHELESYIEV